MNSTEYSATRLRQRLTNVYWLGGSPCSGKSTIADLLHKRTGIRVYHIDEAVRARFGPYDPLTQPCMHRWTHNTERPTFWDDIWMRPASALLEEVIQCYREQFDLVIDELLTMDRATPILVEGNSLLPEAVSPIVKNDTHAIWIVPTEGFQRAMYPKRGAWVQQILSQCSEPASALRNWMDRDVLFAQRVASQAPSFGYKVIWVNGERSIDENAAEVAEHFGLASDG